MGYMDKVIEDAKSEPAADVSQQPDTKSANADGSVQTNEPAADGAETAVENIQKRQKDTSSFTKAEKAQYAFRRQLEKQRNKYESQIKEIHDSFQKQFDDFKKELADSKPKEAPKNRNDFDTDDEYISYLVKSQNDAYRKEMEENDAKGRAEKEAVQKAEQEAARQRDEMTGVFKDNIRKTFNDDKSFSEFSAKVNRGIENGLGEILDNAPAVRDYIFTNPNGVRVLDRMLSDKETFVRIMSNAGNPIAATIEMHEVAREIAAGSQQRSAGTMPKIGKPGAKTGAGNVGIGGSDRDIIRFLRSRR